MPRFPALNEHDRMGVFAFHLRLTPEWLREPSQARVAALRPLLHACVTRVWPEFGPGRPRLVAAPG